LGVINLTNPGPVDNLRKLWTTRPNGSKKLEQF